MEEYVIGFHVPVHDVVLVQNLEGLQKFLEDQKGFRLG